MGSDESKLFTPFFIFSLLFPLDQTYETNKQKKKKQFPPFSFTLFPFSVLSTNQILYKNVCLVAPYYKEINPLA